MIATKRIHRVAGTKEQRRPTLACITSFPRCMLNILTSHVVVNALNAPTKEPKIGIFIKEKICFDVSDKGNGRRIFRTSRVVCIREQDVAGWQNKMVCTGTLFYRGKSPANPCSQVPRTSRIRGS